MTKPADTHTAEAARTPAPDFTTRTWKLGDALVSLLARCGVGPIHLLTTRGRVTGRPRTTPVVPITLDDREWLVAPYGVVSWVRNVRASQTARLRYGRSTRDFVVREASAVEAGPVLARYVSVATKTRTQFRAEVGSPTEDFVGEAAEHPVFELIPAEEIAPESETP